MIVGETSFDLPASEMALLETLEQIHQHLGTAFRIALSHVCDAHTDPALCVLNDSDPGACQFRNLSPQGLAERSTVFGWLASDKEGHLKACLVGRSK